MTDESFVSLISIRQSLSKCSLNEYNQILNDFMNKFGMNTLNNIIFNTLYKSSNTNKFEWISFLNDKVNNLSDTQSMDIETDDCLLMNIHTDELTHICQYLTINDLSILEQCNTFLFNEVRTSPYFVTTLDYPLWSKYYQKIDHDIDKIHRFSCVKKLFLMDGSIYFDAFESIINNITHLSTDSFSIFPQCDALKLQSLTTFKTATHKMQTLYYDDDDLFVPNTSCTFESLIELKMYEIDPNLCSLLILLLLSRNKLQRLEFYVEDEMKLDRYRNEMDSGSHIHIPDEDMTIDQIGDNAPLWKCLRHFVYDKGSANCYRRVSEADKIILFVDKMILNCKCLETLKLRNIRKNELYPTFYENFNLVNIKDISLHLSCAKIAILLKQLTDVSPVLESIDLLLWDHISDEDFRTSGSDILNYLRDLLLYQFSDGGKLRDITLKCESTVWESTILHQLDRVKLLYLMLINVFKNNKIKQRKELNIILEIVYKYRGRSDDTLQNYVHTEFDLINRLLDILNQKIECFSMKFIIDFPNNNWFKLSQFNTFAYELNSKHGFTTTMEGANCVFVYKIVNIENDLTAMNDECDEEKRLECISYIESDVIDNRSFEQYPTFSINYCLEELRLKEDNVNVSKDGEVINIQNGHFSCYPVLNIRECVITHDEHWMDIDDFSIEPMGKDNRTIKPTVCFTCGTSENLMRCSACKSAFYCSRDHQVQDWPRHSQFCHPPVKPN